MRAQLLRSIAVACVTAAGFATTAEAADSPLGVWIDHTGRGAVEVKDCGDGALCGRVVWLQNAADSKGCGLQILGDVAPVGGGQWDNGWIYSPEKKQKFNVEVTPLDGKRLRIKGYKGIKLFSKTMIWHRAPADLKRCDRSTTTAAVSDNETVKAPAVTPSVSKPSVVVPEATTESDINPQRRPEKAAAADPALDATSDTFRADPEPALPNGNGERDAVDGQPEETVKPRRRGIAGLLEDFDLENGIEVGDKYGLDVDKGPNGEKNCLLKVPFVTVEIPCED
jgi:uncharacterized protein (DUF2147 family)